jgi:hypothetical protein
MAYGSWASCLRSVLGTKGEKGWTGCTTTTTRVKNDILTNMRHNDKITLGQSKAKNTKTSRSLKNAPPAVPQ